MVGGEGALVLDLLTLVLLVSDVALATTVFILVAKPDLGVAFVLRSTGIRDDWFEEHVAPEELTRLRTSVRLVGYLGLAVVFCWSFIVGTMMTVNNLVIG